MLREEGEQFIEGDVRIETWRMVTGEEPEYFY